MFDACARYDFDSAVVLFGESVEGMLEEQVERVARSRPKNVKPTELVPRWTLGRLLHMDTARDDDMSPEPSQTPVSIAPGTSENAAPLDLTTLDWGE